MFKYEPSYYKKRSFKDSISRLTVWDPTDTLDTLNYQRNVLADSSSFAYRSRYTKIGRELNDKMKSLQCVNKMTEKWFIAYGLADKFLYLLEVTPYGKVENHIIVKGIFEPSAIISNNRNLENDFRDQFETAKGKYVIIRNFYRVVPSDGVTEYSFEGVLIIAHSIVHVKFQFLYHRIAAFVLFTCILISHF